MFFNYLEKLASDGNERQRVVNAIIWFIIGYTLANLVTLLILAFT
jgi:hypothetical protein